MSQHTHKAYLHVLIIVPSFPRRLQMKHEEQYKFFKAQESLMS